MADKYINPQGLQTIKSWVEGKIPTQTSDLTNDSGFITSSDIPQEIFCAIYGTTTSEEIEDAYQAGKVVICILDAVGLVFTLSNRTSATLHVFSSLNEEQMIEAKCTNDTWSYTIYTYQTNITATGLLKGNGVGSISSAVAGTDYQTPLTAGTDYQVPLPSQTGNSGKYLTTNGTNLSWSNIGNDVFYAEYNVTSYADITAAYAAGKFIIVTRALNGTTMYLFNDIDANGTYYFRAFSNQAYTNYGCYINSSGTWAVNSYTYAPLNSPVFSGTPTAPTPASTLDTSMRIATTEFVQAAINYRQGVFFATYDSTSFTDIETAVEAGKLVVIWYEPNYVTCIFNDFTVSGGNRTGCYFSGLSKSNGLSYPRVTKLTLTSGDVWGVETYNVALLDSPAFSGNPTAPTQTAGNNSTRIATTAFVQTAISGKADKASPTFTGTPKAPTAAAGTNTTQIATTAFVATAISNAITATLAGGY